jgi:hypothetical protein
MNNKFDVYKWRREQLDENENNLQNRAEKIYNSIVDYLKPHDKNSIIRRLMFALMETNKLTEEKTTQDQLFDSFKKLTNGNGSHRPDVNRIKVKASSAPTDEEAKEFFNQNGYNVDIKFIDGEAGEELDMIWYTYS